jgi:sec-independent protein translocase protein TatA
MVDPTGFLSLTHCVAFLGSLGMQELLVILLIILVLFGGARIPQLMGGLGEGLKNFKKSMREGEEEANSEKKKADEKREKVS